MRYQFLSSKNKDAGVKLIASLLIDFLQEKLKKSNVVNVLMSGGNTPLALYKELLTNYSDFSWDKCRFIMLDERYIPFESTQSNAGQCYRHFAQHVNLLGFLYPNTTLGIEKSVTDFAQSIQLLGISEIDIAILGTAADGHIASIFPGNQPFFISGCSFACNTSNNEKRISLSLDFINQSASIWMMAFGAEKQNITKRAKNNEWGTLPALSLNVDKNIHWFTSDDK